jgi:GxxExxY protein
VCQHEFKDLDFQVMRHAFDSHNGLGSLANEDVYQRDLANRLERHGFRVNREVELLLTHGSFTKSLFLDLVVNEFAVYELKVAKAISEAHVGQLLSYLYLLNLERGKVINFGSRKVESRFVNSALSHDERRSFSVDEASYCGPEFLRRSMVELVGDWGTSLSVSLYREAMVHLLGGSESVEAMIDMKLDGMDTGKQRFCLASPDETFQITSLYKTDVDFESHLKRLLAASPLSRLHWINVERHRLQFVTVHR